MTADQLSLFGETTRPAPPCSHPRPTTHEHLEALIQASSPGCCICNHAALAYWMRIEATHGGTRPTGKRPGMDFGHTPPTPADRARAHADLDEFGVPPSGTPWSELVAWAIAKQRQQALT